MDRITIIHSAAVAGIKPVPVTVEVAVSDGIGIHLVGLADASVKETLLRVVTALQANGYSIPGKKIVINLAPADLRKSGSVYDLPIALALLVASGQEDLPDLDRWTAVGELSLYGKIRPVDGCVQAVEAAIAGGKAGAMVPFGNAAEMADAFDDTFPIFAPATLGEAVALVKDASDKHTVFGEPRKESRSEGSVWDSLSSRPMTRRAVEIAAAGGHPLLIAGPADADMEVIARALLELLPDPTPQERMTLAEIRSVSGARKEVGVCRPFRAPHFSVSVPAMLGGGAEGSVRPGEVTLSHAGVLFLEEADSIPESVQVSLEAVEENRKVTIRRLRSTVELPAAHHLVLAVEAGPGSDSHTTARLAARFGRIYGPLMDRMTVHLLAGRSEGRDATGGEPLEEARERVLRAIRRQDVRHIGKPYTRNDEAPEKDIFLDDACEEAFARFSSMVTVSEGFRRAIVRIARTIADLEGSEAVRPRHLMEAAGFRCLLLDKDAAGIGK